MSHKTVKARAYEKRKGESALSEFAAYVEQQQNLRFPASKRTQAGPATGAESAEHHEELDELFDNLDLADTAPRMLIRDLLLGSDEDALKKLEAIVAERLEEGMGETVFELGYEDNGDFMRLTLHEWTTALERLVKAAKGVRADCTLLLTKNVGGEIEAASTANKAGKDSSCSGKILIRRVPAKAEDVIETRIAVVGNVDAGKSSLLGVLVKGDLDDGRGKARVSLFRHKHEMETGRTSSVGMEVMGFDSAGRVVTSDTPGRKLSWEDIGKRSAKVITFTDLAGHERYLRTTVFGLLSSSPDYCLLMVAANHGMAGMSKEHLGIALALNVPVMVVITKIDICPTNILEQTITEINKIMKSPGARKMPIFIKNHEECINTATQFVSHRICPVFQVSNVTGENLHLVRTFLNILPHHGRYNTDAPFEFHVNDTWSVPFVGTVVSGIVKSGVAHEGDGVLIGPDSLGHFTSTAIRSIERKRIRVPAASAGQSASFALKKVKRKEVRKGMVMLPKLEGQAAPKVYKDFVAEVLILSHTTTIKTKYQAMLHVGPVSQTCAIIDIDRELLRAGDRATVAFRFVQRPEYLAPGDRLLFREGRTKGLGIVKSIGYDPQSPLTPRADATNSSRGEGDKEGERPRQAGQGVAVGANARLNEDARGLVRRKARLVDDSIPATSASSKASCKALEIFSALETPLYMTTNAQGGNDWQPRRLLSGVDSMYRWTVFRVLQHDPGAQSIFPHEHAAQLGELRLQLLDPKDQFQTLSLTRRIASCPFRSVTHRNMQSGNVLFVYSGGCGSHPLASRSATVLPILLTAVFGCLGLLKTARCYEVQ